MTITQIKQDVVDTIKFRRPLSWRSYFTQAVVAMIEAAIALGFLQLIGLDVPWRMIIIGLPVVFAVAAVFRAMKIWVRTRRHTGP
jgi:hypothetical protein